MNRLHKYLPPYHKKSKVFEEITRVESDEFDKLDLDIEDLSKQFVVDTATWGLAIYEKELGLPIKPDKTHEERRPIIKAKMRGIGKVDFLMIKAIVEAYTSNIVTIEFDGRINIVFNMSNHNLNIQDMSRSIGEIKPAHLDFDLTMNLKQDKNKYDSDIYIASAIVCGEKITVYPYNVRKIEVSSKVYIASGDSRGSEGVTVYPEIARELKVNSKLIIATGENRGSEEVIIYPEKEE